MTKTYQVLHVSRFPSLGESNFSTKTQLTMWGERETIRTRMRLIDTDKKRKVEIIRLKSSIQVRAYGFIKYFDEDRGAVAKRNFSEYMKPVEFDCFHFPKESVVLFQAPKLQCKGVLNNLANTTDEIVLSAPQVDFRKLPDAYGKLSGAWFRNVSPNIRSEGFTGSGIEDDERVSKLLDQTKCGNLGVSLSTITVPYEFEEAIHHVQITKDGAICLQSQYGDTEVELDLVMAVKKDLLDKML